MAGPGWLSVTLVLGCLLLAEADVCYRKYVTKRQSCRKPMKRAFGSMEDCCRNKRAAGYAPAKVRNGKLFECAPCPKQQDDVDQFLAETRRKFQKTKTKSAATKAANKATTTATSDQIEGTTVRPRLQKKSNSLPSRKNGGWTEWSVWSACSKTCMAGIQERIRLCPEGACEGPHKEARPCSAMAYCPVDGRWGPWYPWEACSRTCAGGVQLRKRQCNNPPPLHGGRKCEGNGTETRECGGQKCPVHGQWAGWSSFSDCSVTCGKGIKVRMRQCTNPPPSYGGKWCKGKSIQQKKCHLRMCPIHGGWSLWSAWTHPSVTCGEAMSVRRRMCDSPKPQFGGQPCGGDAIQFRSYIHKYDCPVDGGWTEWTSFGTCGAAPCQRGYQLRSRSCTNPKPKNGGRYCVGRPLEKQECVNHEECHKVTGKWCEWSTWGPCTLTCGVQDDLSYKKRIRECACPPPKNGGNDCSGERFQTQDCKLSPCPSQQPIELDMPILQNAGAKTQSSLAALPAKTDATRVTSEEEPEVGSGQTTTGSPRPCGVAGSGDSDGSEVACDQEGEEEEGQ